MSSKRVWLDTDPGHDDALAILLASNIPGLNLVGVSTVHGNATADCTLANAVRLLYAFAPQLDIIVYPGATRPLMRPSRADPEIHGADGLGGVEGLPSLLSAPIISRLNTSKLHKAIHGIAAAVQDAQAIGEKLYLVACGPLTNIALFISIYPELVEGIEELCFMGGGVGVGNRSAVAEFNILCDPEAAQIVFDAPVRKIMMPLNVTHTAILTPRHHDRLKGSPSSPTTPLRHTISTLVSFFASTYRSTFGFVDGPPLHDPLTIAYIANPGLFRTTRYRVDVDCSPIGSLGVGQTVADVWNYRNCDEDSWGSTGKNVLVAEECDIEGFFDLLMECVERCDAISPLNTIDAGVP